MLQQSLFVESKTPALARRSDPATSHIAAARMRESGAAGRQAQAVLAAVRQWPGSTAVEIAQLAGIDRYAVSRRLPELAKAGSVRRSAPRNCTVNGRPQTTWRVVLTQ